MYVEFEPVLVIVKWRGCGERKGIVCWYRMSLPVRKENQSQEFPGSKFVDAAANVSWNQTVPQRKHTSLKKTPQGIPAVL